MIFQWLQRNKPQTLHDPIIYRWPSRHDPDKLQPYARVRQIDRTYPLWDRIVQRRAALYRLRDANFLPKTDRRHWDRDQQEVAANFAELLQPPTHIVELGFRRGNQRHAVFREGFHFGLIKSLKSDYVAVEVAKFMVVMFQRMDFSKPGLIADLRDDWHQVDCLGNLLAAYKHLKSI